MTFKCKFTDGSVELYNVDIPYSLGFFMEQGRAMECLNRRGDKTVINFNYVIYAYALDDNSIEASAFEDDEIARI